MLHSSGHELGRAHKCWGDLEPFIRVMYYQDYDWYEQQFPGMDPICPADCNGDGYLSIVGDLSCFIECLYYGECDR